MSFDTEFDYTGLLNSLALNITNFQNEISNIDNEIALYDNAPNYTSVTENRKNLLVNMKNNLSYKIQKNQEITDEINNLILETPENKATLYYFYTVVEPDKKYFMIKALFNYSAALNNQKIQELMNDDITPSESKVAVAKLIYEDFQINQEYAIFLNPNVI